MSTTVLATKLYIPPPRPKIVLRPRLIKRLNEGIHCKLTLISAPAGFGKTTLVSEWLTGCQRPVAWVQFFLILGEGGLNPIRPFCSNYCSKIIRSGRGAAACGRTGGC
jgi:LuxR family transcriptional regulator, maltose regulon positive regulatory protein